MPFQAEAITVTPEERTELEQMTQSRTLPAGYHSANDLAMEAPPSVTVHGCLLEIRHPGQKPSVIRPVLQAKVLEATRRNPADGSTHWSCRKLAKHLQVCKDRVQRIWHKARLKPHRLERYMASNDPDFESKAADFIALYLSPPQHAAVFCVDEKAAIQALDRLDQVLPMSPGRVERHGLRGSNAK